MQSCAIIAFFSWVIKKKEIEPIHFLVSVAGFLIFLFIHLFTWYNLSNNSAGNMFSLQFPYQTFQSNSHKNGIAVESGKEQVR